MSGNYKVKIKDIQNKYKFKIFCASNYDDSELKKMYEAIYMALPKESSSGTSNTLNDTAKSFMMNKLYATEISQETTSISGGDEYDSPTPDHPQPVHVVSGDNTIKVCGKNLIDATTIILDATAQSKYKGLAPNVYLEAGTYTLSWVQKNSMASNLRNTPQVVRVSDSTVVKRQSEATNFHLSSGLYTYTFTLDTSGTYQMSYWYHTLSQETTLENLMLNEGSTPLPYEPYKSNSVLLTLGDKEICKIGNYEDKIFKAIKGNEIYDSLASEEKATLDYGKWYLRKNVGKVVYTGANTENWTLNPGISNTFVISRPNGLQVSDNNVFYNYFKTVPDLSVAIEGARIGVNINLKNKDISTVENFRTWLGTHNTLLYYQTTVPTNELFNDTIQEQLEDIYFNMLSYEGQTNISQVNNNLPFNINSSALKDLSDL